MSYKLSFPGSLRSVPKEGPVRYDHNYPGRRSSLKLESQLELFSLNSDIGCRSSQSRPPQDLTLGPEVFGTREVNVGPEGPGGRGT